MSVQNIKGNVSKLPVVDNTLTRSGYSADAKATGDAIAENKQRIEREAARLDSELDVERGKIDQIANNQIPEEYLEAAVDKYVKDNEAGLATKAALETVESELKSDLVKLSPNLMGTKTGYRYPVNVTKGEKITISTSDGSNFPKVTMYGVNTSNVVTGYYPLSTSTSYQTISASDDFAYLYWATSDGADTIVPLMVEFGANHTTYKEYMGIADELKKIVLLENKFKDKKIYANMLNLDAFDLSNQGILKEKKYLSGYKDGLPLYNSEGDNETVTIELPFDELGAYSITVPLSINQYLKSLMPIVFYNGTIATNITLSQILSNAIQYIVYDSATNEVTINTQAFKDAYAETHVAISFDVNNYYIKMNGGELDVVGRKNLKADINVTNALDVVISPSINIVDGYSLPIYYDNFISDVQDASKVCSKIKFSHGGMSKYNIFPKGAYLTSVFADAYNPHPTDFHFYDHNGKMYSSISAVRCVDTSAGSGVTKKVLCIGDSLTDDGRYIGKTMEKFADDVMNVEFVGTKGNGTISNPYRNGNSGWNSKAYVTKATFNGVTNPFFNPNTNKFDFDYYCTQNQIEPNVVLLALGTNEITVSVDGTPTVDEIITYWETMITSIKAHNANIVIIIWLCPIPCQTNGYVQLAEKIARMSVIKKLLSRYQFDSRCRMLPIYPIISDSDYNTTTLEVSENESYTRCTDNLHFMDSGHEKISVALYSMLKYIGSL